MLHSGPTYDLSQILPHGPGMVLLDRLTGYEAETATCEVTIRSDSPFCDGREVPAWVGLEYMAQTLGAYTGIARLQQGKNIQVELLLGTRALDCSVASFKVGTTLTVRARKLFWDPDGVVAFACEIRAQGAVVSAAQIKGYEPEDIEPFLQNILKQSRLEQSR